MVDTESAVLTIEKCHVKYFIRKLSGALEGTIHAVNDVNLSIRHSEIVGLLGESGCGKTTLGKAVMRLVPICEGSMKIGDLEWGKLHGESLRKNRYRVQMVFQNPYGSLNPRLTIADTLKEAATINASVKRSAHDEIEQNLIRVGLDPSMANRFPHEFSGGQRQRIAIARALATGPDLLIADEPVSSLDVSVQAQIVNLLYSLRKESGLSILFISHDIALARYLCDRIAVMYLGHIVETGTRESLFSHASHPYTNALISAAPDIIHRSDVKIELLDGEPPSFFSVKNGCPFRSRCPRAIDRCKIETPHLTLVDSSHDHEVACHNPL